MVTKYSPFRGHRILLDGIRRKLERVNGLDVPDAEVIVVPGGAAALFSIVAVLLTSDRRNVVVADPCWEHYPNIVTAAGGRPVRVPTRRDGAHDAIDLEALSRAVGTTTAAVLLNTPLNPTGSVLTPAELDVIGDICARAGAELVVDEEYETFVYGGRPHTTARAARRDNISLFSFSKSFALTGIRLGYITAPARIVDALKRFGLYSYMYPPSPSQVMAAHLLGGDLGPYLRRVRDHYEECARHLHRSLDALPGVTCAMPEGGVYVFPRIAGPDGTSLATELIGEQHLLCVPGEVAGEAGRGHVRLFAGVDRELADRAIHRIGAVVSGA
jgi:aspartate/methionine/tyrosine aminotransferase